MHYYAAYGLTIRSTFELPELPTCEPGTADVVFERDRVEPVSDADGDCTDRHIRAEPDRCWLTYDSIGTFCVEHGRRVRFDPVDPSVVETMRVRRLFENEMCGLLAHQRGCLVLHASAVSVGDTAAIFLGPCGAGKSTTAAAFHAAGYDILEDDVVAIEFENGTPTVLPGVPQLRLRPDATTAFDIATTRHPDDGGTGKHYHSVTDVPKPTPLGGCYTIQDGPSLTLEAHSGPDQLFELLVQTYAWGLLEETETTADHFRQCSRLLETVPCQLLTRPVDHSRLSELVSFVVSDVTDHGSPDP